MMNFNSMDGHTDHILPSNQQQPEQRKKCHGNRRNQRFRRKCRNEQMKPMKIKKLIDKRNRFAARNQKHNTTTQTTNPNLTLKLLNDKPTIRNKDQSHSTTTNLNKRKLDLSSLELSRISSSVSMVQSPSKKSKNVSAIVTDPVVNHNDNDKNEHMTYRRPMYLTRSASILRQIIQNTLKYSLKKKDEQQFIHRILEQLDRQYCLERDEELWKSYLQIGSQQRLWPNQVYDMAQTKDFDSCKEYVINYIQNIKTQLNQCRHMLIKEQYEKSAIPNLSIEQIQYHLKELVNRERNYLSKRNEKELIKFKDEIYEKELRNTISVCFVNVNERDVHLNQLIQIREKQAEIWKEQLMLETRIICKLLPENFEHLEHFIAPITYSPLNDERKSVDIRNKRQKIIQEGKRKWLNYLLNIYEIKIEEYEQQYRKILIQLESQLLYIAAMNRSTIVNDTVNEYLNYHINNFKRDIDQQLSVFRRTTLRNRQRSSSMEQTIGVSPEPYLDLESNPYDKCQWNYLSLGPSFIRLNQSAIRPECQQRVEINREHTDIQKKVEDHLVDPPHYIPRTVPLFKEYSNHLLDYLNNSYFTPLRYKDHLETLEQAQILNSIRQINKNMELIIRVTDKGHNFYIGSAIDFEKKANKFFQDTKAFTELSYNPFNEILDKVIELLDKLQSKKLILKWQCKEMMPDRKECELPHLYFNPKTHKDGIPVRPIENTIRAPTKKISKFLDSILRPIFNDTCKATTIIDGASLINELNNYTEKGLLKPTTLFCTCDIRNLYTMLPQDEALNILMGFLSAHGYKKVKGINLDTIRKLASIVIKENVFVYGKKIYQQTTGGAMGSSFTLTLANIFMWNWQKKLVDEQRKTGEFYGRYIDDIIMTWNKSEEELRYLLDHANTWHPNIKLDYKISRSLPFLDVFLTNSNGILLTSVYHKPASEPYVIPFTSDHPPHVFTNVIKNSLTRAIRYSSTFQAFNYERRNIKLMLLYNGYPSTFIENEFRKHLGGNPSQSPFLPWIEDESQFFLIRHKLLGQPTPLQSQLAISAALADLDNEPTDDQPKPLAETHLKPNNENKTTAAKLFVHYTHEKRFESFKRDMHHVYEDVFANTPAMHATIVVGNRNRRETSDELIRKRPDRTILRNIFTQRQQKKQLRRLQRIDQTDTATKREHATHHSNIHD